MKKLELNQMELYKGGSSGRGCLIAGALGVLSLGLAGGGLIAGISIFAGAALSDCFYAVPVEPLEPVGVE